MSWWALRPSPRHHHEREHLLLPGRQAVAEAPDQLGGRAPASSGAGARSSSSRVATTTCSLAVRIARVEQRAQRRRDVGLLVGRHQVHEDRRGRRRARARPRRAAWSSAAYASSTKRHVVSMPFQSSRSLKAARPLKNSATQKSANQNRPVAPEPAQSASTLAQRGVPELRDGNFSTVSPSRTIADLLAGELLDVGGIVAQPLDRAARARPACARRVDDARARSLASRAASARRAPIRLPP